MAWPILIFSYVSSFWHVGPALSLGGQSYGWGPGGPKSFRVRLDVDIRGARIELSSILKQSWY